MAIINSLGVLQSPAWNSTPGGDVVNQLVVTEIDRKVNDVDDILDERRFRELLRLPRRHPGRTVLGNQTDDGQWLAPLEVR